MGITTQVRQRESSGRRVGELVESDGHVVVQLVVHPRTNLDDRDARKHGECKLEGGLVDRAKAHQIREDAAIVQGVRAQTVMLRLA